MSVGETPKQKSLLSSSTEYCDGRLGKSSLYALLNREGENLFPDESFADIFSDEGRPFGAATCGGDSGWCCNARKG